MTEPRPDDLEDHDLGLSQDLPRLVGRRTLLGMLGLAGAATVVGCGSASDSSDPGATGERSGTPPEGGPDGPDGPGAPPGGGGGVEVGEGEIPEETNGPYPADGTNGVNVLTASGIVRSDIRSSFGAASATAEGVPMTIELTVIDVTDGETVGPLSGAAVYAWQCDRDGNYSMYSEAIADENYLRGVQATDDNGKVTFESIFPAAYSGRSRHVHFEVYPSLEAATRASDRMRTSQLALPEDVCDTVYAEPGYESSVQNLAQISLDSDNVFSDGYSLQMAKVTGSVEEGYVARLNVPV